ncbi:hypothetical protein Pcinc_019894 [Petrolisthes cinctipes]|uniref:Uncharacterized protein n=1 Tax=Petrolisthes cinctipes TaxID=88211 RepID=A0AAE1FKD4_PETCI|nr:hypothetical protein Pcinc_019894 [Petrolisthes cinctipes]
MTESRCPSYDDIATNRSQENPEYDDSSSIQLHRHPSTPLYPQQFHQDQAKCSKCIYPLTDITVMLAWSKCNIMRQTQVETPSEE